MTGQTRCGIVRKRERASEKCNARGKQKKRERRRRRRRRHHHRHEPTFERRPILKRQIIVR